MPKTTRKLKISYFLAAIMILLSAFAIYKFSDSNGKLEEKSTTVYQNLNQVQVIGTRVGQTPPDFTVISTEAKPVNLQKLVELKKPVIVYFMATWCPWCAKDYEALSKVYKKYEDDIEFISISLDLSEDFLELGEYKKKYPELQKMIFAQGQEKILSDYSVTKTTTKYALDSNGTVMYYTIGTFSEDEWKTLLDKMMNK